MMSSIDALPNWNALSAKQQLLILRQEKVRRVSTRRFDLFYPETGPIRLAEYHVRVAHGPLVQSLAHSRIGNLAAFFYGTRKFRLLGNPFVDCRYYAGCAVLLPSVR